MPIMRTDTREFYKTGIGTENGPTWTASKWDRLDARTELEMLAWWILKQEGFQVVIV